MSRRSRLPLRSRRPAIPPFMMPFVLVALVLGWPAHAAAVQSSSLVEIVRSGPRSSGAVALTFDDGWGVSSCERIGRTLRRNGAVGTFFINGIHIKADPVRWRKILRGMPVGNHTRSHHDLATSSPEHIYKQIRQNELLHERLLHRPMLKVLRPPYGAYDRDVERVAAGLGYRHLILWSVSTADTSPAATTQSIIRHATGARPGSIILMHCARDVTAAALPTIIRHYQRRGIELVGLDTLLGLKASMGQAHARSGASIAMAGSARAVLPTAAP